MMPHNKPRTALRNNASFLHQHHHSKTTAGLPLLQIVNFRLCPASIFANLHTLLPHRKLGSKPGRGVIVAYSYSGAFAPGFLFPVQRIGVVPDLHSHFPSNRLRSHFGSLVIGTTISCLRQPGTSCSSSVHIFASLWLMHAIFYF